jgi:hypothetical protein
LEALDAAPGSSAITMAEWIEHHIGHQTALRKSTLYDYRTDLTNDIAPVLGELTLTSLSLNDIAR